VTKSEDTFPYFFIHENKDGYQVAFQQALYGYYVLILKDGEELAKFRTGNPDNLYRRLYKWLAYLPSDVEFKCEKLMKNKDNLPYFLELLPMKDSVDVDVPKELVK
jgi:hypothetical protein